MAFLEKKGYTVIPFHAQGIGDSAMEELLEQGLFQGVLDLVPAGVIEELLGGNRAAGPHRLESAGKAGIPQVYTPCGFDMLSCGPLGRREAGDPLWTSLRLAERKIFIPDEFRVQARTSGDEVRKVAEMVGRKLNASRGPVKFFIPTRGWSSLSTQGGGLHEPGTDALFAPALKRSVRPGIEVSELPMELNSPDFAEVLATALDGMIKESPNVSRPASERSTRP
ncbi:MAG: Tm-1-like ATP-binding domain-containing protein, partial [Deltaproteobacteria bacterium]